MAGLQGKVFAGYQLAAQIGSGGIAEVYRARAQDGTREVAVKVVAAEYSRDAAFQQRFSQYVQTAQRLGSHPHVLPLLASGVENGAHYLVTPYVQDGTLRDRLRGGFRLGPADVAPFLHQLANALDYAHKQGIVHGNLKPSNIYLYEGRHLLLGDFGLLWDVTKLEMKRKGPGAEAVECFAPEAFAGKVTPASDIYSLGAVLFATLTGRAPFTGKTPGDVYNAHLRQPVPPIEQINSKLPASLRALDPVISRAMAKRPEERFSSAGLMVQVVETAVQPVGAMTGRPAGQMGQALGGAGMPGVMPGVMSAPLSAPLQPLDFPPLPSSEEASGLMDEGHIAANLNEGVAQGMHPLGAGQAPYPLPGQSPSMMTGAPQPFPGQQYAGQYPNQYPGQYPGQLPAAMPQQRYPGPGAGAMPGAIPGGEPQGPLLPPQPGMPPGFGPMGAMPAPMGPPMSGPVDPPAQPGYVPGLGPIPLGGAMEPPANNPRAAKGYSATELNLPRLSRVELGPLSPMLEQQMQAQLEATPAGGTEVVAAHIAVADPERNPPPDDEEWDESQAYSAVQSAYDDSRESQAMRYGGDGWTDEQSAAYAAPRPEWDYTDERSVEVSARRPSARPARRGRDDWDDDEFAAISRGRGRGRDRGERERGGRRSSRRAEYNEYDDRYDEGYSRRSRRRRDDYDDEYDTPYASGRGGGWVRGLLIALIPLVLLTLSGVAVMRPDLCPVSTCQKVSDKVHQLVPALGGGGNAGTTTPAPTLTASPAQIQASTNATTPVSTQLKLTNSGTSDAAWQGSAGLTWVTLAPANGTVPAGSTATVTVTANPAGQAPNTYTTTISIKSGGTTISVPLQITVTSS